VTTVESVGNAAVTTIEAIGTTALAEKIQKLGSISRWCSGGYVSPVRSCPHLRF